MKHKVLQPIQKEWLGWIIKDHWDWLKGKIDAELNHQRLNWTYETGLYDAITKQLLNYILTEFHKDLSFKYEWHLKREWDKANII
jgi:hypothetical protein